MVDRKAGPARRGVAIFLVLVGITSAVIEWLIIRAGGTIDKQPALVVALMWMPGLACIATRILRREGFADVSFAFGGSRGVLAIVLAWLFPVLIGGVAYGSAWATGLAEFSPGKGVAIPSMMALYDVNFLMHIARALAIAAPLSMVLTMGEELGWRGYLLPRLVRARVPAPILWSGVIWGLWHVPLIVSGQYVVSSDPRLSAAVFCASVIGGAYVFGWLRLYSGSIWPSVLGHASWNVVIQDVFDKHTAGSSPWVGEGGVLTLVALAFFAVFLWRFGPRTSSL